MCEAVVAEEVYTGNGDVDQPAVELLRSCELLQYIIGMDRLVWSMSISCVFISVFCSISALIFKLKKGIQK